VVSGFEMRVGDADREAAAAELREHFASGRLTQDELNERLDQVFAAKTRGDLHALTLDLPSAQPGWAPGAATAGAPYAGIGAGYGRAGYGDAGYGGRSRGAGDGWGHGARRSAGALVASFVMLAALLTFGIVAAFGFGGGRPFWIVLVFAALALLRRLIFGIFRQGRGRSRGPRRGPRGRRR